VYEGSPDMEEKKEQGAETQITELKEIVQRHKVCWEVLPEYTIDASGKKVQIGFDLILTGTIEPHHGEETIMVPGCSECIRVLEDLRKIADWIIPKGEGCSCRWEIQTLENMVQFASARRFREDMVIKIRVLHCQQTEEDCLKKMEQALKSIGAQKVSWKEIRNQNPDGGKNR
jgi:hypothetical protein